LLDSSCHSFVSSALENIACDMTTSSHTPLTQ